MFVPGNNPGMMADAHIYGPIRSCSISRTR